MACFLGKEMLLASPLVHFVGERSSSFSRGVDGIDEYDGRDDGDVGGGGGGGSDDGGRREYMTRYAGPTPDWLALRLQ